MKKPLNSIAKVFVIIKYDVDKLREKVYFLFI